MERVPICTIRKEKAYLDFAAGYAVNSLGYGNEEWNQALKSQIDHLAHTSNLYYHTRTKEAAEALKRVSGMDRIFFCNSGGEAIEGALKASRKYAYTKKSGRYEWIAMEESFHGRGFGAVSVTGHKAYQEPFEPLVPGVRFAKYNDLESVKELVTDKTCAIILEPVQGEGGINVATEEFLTGIRRICDEKDILLIFDEVQCGMGRTGSFFAWQQYGVRPDILTMAKAIGNGFPVGAFALTEKVAECSLNPGDHGTTYGEDHLPVPQSQRLWRSMSASIFRSILQRLALIFANSLKILRDDTPASYPARARDSCREYSSVSRLQM